MLLFDLALCALAQPAVALQTEWRVGPLESCLATAQATQKPVLVYFWLEGSDYCAKLWGETLTAEGVQPELGEFVCVSADVVTPFGADLVARYSVATLPTVLVLSADGEVEDALIGVLPELDFIAGLRKIRAGDGTLSSLRRAAQAAPDDLAARYALGLKLQHVGAAAAGAALIESIRSEDPQGRTLMGARLALWDLMTQLTAGGDDVIPDLTPLHKHLRAARQPEVLYEGWNWIANLEREQGNLKESRAALAKAWPHVAPADLIGWSFEGLPTFWRDREALKGSERKLALEIATAAAERAQAEVVPAQQDSLDTAADCLEVQARFAWLSGRREAARSALESALALVPEHAAALATRELVEGRNQVSRQ